MYEKVSIKRVIHEGQRVPRWLYSHGYLKESSCNMCNLMANEKTTSNPNDSEEYTGVHVKNHLVASLLNQNITSLPSYR